MLRAIYYKFGAKYRAHPPVYAIWTVAPDIHNVVSAPNIQAPIFNWTYLRCYWRYGDNSMRVVLQTWCHIQRTSSSLRHVNCGPGHIQSTYSSASICFNIRWNVSALLLQISRECYARYTANLVPNTAHILQFTPCELWSWPYTKYLQRRMFRIEYSTVGICAAIVDITSILCSLYCNLFAKCSAHHLAFAMWTVVPHIYKVFTAPHIYASIFEATYLRCYWRYHDNSMCVVLQTWCQIQRTSSSLRYVNCRPGHVQGTYISAYLGFNIQLKVAPLLLEVSRQFNERYTAYLVSNIAHIPQFTPCELWSRPYTKYLQLRMFRIQYSL
jgi:hypothetical protein